ncbi:MAG: hypothetical protein RL274_810 [Pseudomonadota bacterium]|jgi:hypothetical protein
MVHKLAIIAFAGLTGSALCMRAAAAIGGREIADMDFLAFSDLARCQAVAGATARQRILD